jgi:hypothetical protein
MTRCWCGFKAAQVCVTCLIACLPVVSSTAPWWWRTTHCFPAPGCVIAVLRTTTVTAFWVTAAGCSSLFGLFEESGPIRVNANGDVTLNPLSWNRFANTLYGTISARLVWLLRQGSVCLCARCWDRRSYTSAMNCFRSGCPGWCRVLVLRGAH